MTTPTPPTSPHPSEKAWAASIDRAARDRDWQATTSEAVARLDNALTIINARADAIDDDTTRGHVTGILAAVLPTLEQLAQHLAAPAEDADEYPY